MKDILKLFLAQCVNLSIRVRIRSGFVFNLERSAALILS
jgi:hypothetical protein